MAALVGACGSPKDLLGAGDEPITSVHGVEHTIDYDSFVYVAAGSDDATVRAAIRRQVKSSLGALREQGIGVEDRDATHNVSGWKRTPLAVVGADGTPGQSVDRVTYHYHDTALVEASRLPLSTMKLTLLFGDYVAGAAALIPICSDDATTDGDSLWYHFTPSRSACVAAIGAERSAITAAMATLQDANVQISQPDAGRRFLTVIASLTRQAAAPDLYPEYDRLWGFRDDSSRNMLVVYSFFGVDQDAGSASDNGLVEYLRFERKMRSKFPGLRVTDTKPLSMLLDFWIDGAKVDGVTYDDVERWIVDGTGFPAVVGTDSAKRAALKQQVVEKFTSRWIYWDLPVVVSDGATTRTMTFELRTWHGPEDGTEEIRTQARWRYLEAFWNADVFAYTGHSHFGHGPLEPFDYSAQNFPYRYQVFLFNSCLSFNYYDDDFLAMHPAGSKDLDVVVNGLPAYWVGMGEATAGYVGSLVDGQGKTWRALLGAMRVDLPWETGYDPMRAVNGELDDVEYSAATRPLTVTPAP